MESWLDNPNSAFGLLAVCIFLFVYLMLRVISIQAARNAYSGPDSEHMSAPTLAPRWFSAMLAFGVAAVYIFMVRP